MGRATGTVPVSIADGGTGATSAAGARTALGIVQGTLGAVYGGGAHGAFDLDGNNTYASYFSKSGSTYTQIADVRATTIRVRSSASLQPSQFRVYAETAPLNEGTIRTNGNNAVTTTAGASIATAGTIQTAASQGSAGRTTTGTGSAGTAANDP